MYSIIRREVFQLELFNSCFKCTLVLNNGTNNKRQFEMKSRKVVLQGLIDVILPWTAPCTFDTFINPNTQCSFSDFFFYKLEEK